MSIKIIILLFFFINLQSKSLSKINNINIEEITINSSTKIIVISGFKTSYGVDIDKNGYVYIPDFKQGVLYKINLETKNSTILFLEKDNYFKFIEYKNINSFKSNLNQPHDIYIDHNNNLYITEMGYGLGKKGGQILKISNKKGKASFVGRELYNNQGLDGPTVSFVDKENFIYVAEWRAHRILKFYGNNYETHKIFGKYLNENLELEEFKFNYPHSIRIGPDDNYYVADTGNNRIVKFDKDENYIGWIGKRSDGSINNNWSKTGNSIKGEELGAFNEPLDIEFFKDNFYVTDIKNNRILKIDILGKSVGQLGGGNKKGDSLVWLDNENQKSSNLILDLNQPYGLRIKNGMILIADRGNNKIKIIKSNLLD